SFLYVLPRPPTSPLFPYTTLFRSASSAHDVPRSPDDSDVSWKCKKLMRATHASTARTVPASGLLSAASPRRASRWPTPSEHVSKDRKSTRLNSSHVKISYAVFCLK